MFVWNRPGTLVCVVVFLHNALLIHKCLDCIGNVVLNIECCRIDDHALMHDYVLFFRLVVELCWLGVSVIFLSICSLAQDIVWFCLCHVEEACKFLCFFLKQRLNIEYLLYSLTRADTCIALVLPYYLLSRIRCGHSLLFIMFVVLVFSNLLVLTWVVP